MVSNETRIYHGSVISENRLLAQSIRWIILKRSKDFSQIYHKPILTNLADIKIFISLFGCKYFCHQSNHKQRGLS
jgi:hypothetical protein